MANKTVFLCETNHADHAQRLVESMLITNLASHGYNKLILEWSQEYVDSFKREYEDDYYNVFSTSLIFRVFKTVSQCVYDSRLAAIADIELQSTFLDALNKQLAPQGFDEDNAKKHESLKLFCDSLSNPKTLSYFGLQKDENSNYINKELERVDIIRDKKIVKNFVHLTNENNDRKIIFIAGIIHCVDYYNYLKEKNALEKVQFVELNSNLITVTNFEESEGADSNDSTIEKIKFGLQYMCKNKTEAVLENLNNFVGLDKVFERSKHDDYEVCKLKENDYAKDEIHVTRCNIDVTDVDSYHQCLHNVTAAITEA